MNISKQLFYYILFLFLTSCGEKNQNKLSDILTGPGPDGSPADTPVDQVFNFKTSQNIQIQIYTDFEGINFDLYDENNKNLASLYSSSEGLLSTTLTLPKTSSGVYIRSNYIGLPHELYHEIIDNKVELDLRKKSNIDIQTQGISSFISKQALSISGSSSLEADKYGILGHWNRNGVPYYLDQSLDISNDFLEKLNKALPEKKPVPEYRPQYLTGTVETSLHIIKDGDVYVSFIHEGAGYKNTLGFYTYRTSDGPPSEVNDSEITLIFPNVSYRYSGGGLRTGDTVNIGSFSAGTSIGWVLISNAYNQRFASVLNGFNKFYSHLPLNPDFPPYQQHFVQLDFQDYVVLGIEDLLRPGGDNDFNDAVFTVRSSPEDAIDRSGLIKDTSENITEVIQHSEEIELKEPPLFEISGHQFFPGKDEFGTLAFEDLWPHKGDYDFNDLVIDYNIIETLSKNNNIIQLQITLKIVGILASMHNGFGIQLGVLPSDIASVEGARYTKNYTFLNPNGTEQRQEKAVIIAFEDAQVHHNSSIPDNSEQIVISINFNREVSRTELGFAPYNPFILSNGERGREVHLPGYQSTSLVHLPYFGSFDDDSVLGTSYMYKTNDDLPWAIHLPEPFAYPYDSVKISQAFSLFESWVGSDGFSHSDWYTDKPGYRVEQFIKRKK